MIQGAKLSASQRVLRSAPAAGFTLWVFLQGTSRSAPPGPQVSDKLLHAVAFALCAAFYVPVVRLFAALRGSPRQYVWAALASISVGGLLELWQSTLPYRSSEWDDFWADSIGAIFGAWLMAWAARSWARRSNAEAQ